MSNHIKPNVVYQPPLPATGRTEGPTSTPPSLPVLESTGTPVDEVSLRRAPTVMRDVLHSEGKVHDAVLKLHQAKEALEKLGELPGVGGAPTPDPRMGLESAFSQVQAFAQVMSQARGAVLAKGPIPNREAVEYLAKMVAEHSKSEPNSVSAVSHQLPVHAVELAS